MTTLLAFAEQFAPPETIFLHQQSVIFASVIFVEDRVLSRKSLLMGR